MFAVILSLKQTVWFFVVQLKCKPLLTETIMKSRGEGFTVVDGSSMIGFSHYRMCACGVKCVYAVCINNSCMAHYVDNVIPGISHFVCEDQSLVNNVMTNYSTKGISSLHVS